MKSAELRFELNFLVQDGSRPEIQSVYEKADELNKHLEIIDQSSGEYPGISYQDACDRYLGAYTISNEIDEEIKELTARLAAEKQRKATYKKFLTDSQLPKKVKASLAVISDTACDFLDEVKWAGCTNENAPKLFAIRGKLSSFVD